jgi:hypothetical protein
MCSDNCIGGCTSTCTGSCIGTCTSGCSGLSLDENRTSEKINGEYVSADDYNGLVDEITNGKQTRGLGNDAPPKVDPGEEITQKDLIDLQESIDYTIRYAAKTRYDFIALANTGRPVTQVYNQVRQVAVDLDTQQRCITCSSACRQECSYNCYQLCGDGCSNACLGCTWGCTHSCGSDCTNSCYNQCSMSCSTSCSGNCGASACTAECKSANCTGNCYTTCANSCKNACSGSCSGSIANK